VRRRLPPGSIREIREIRVIVVQLLRLAAKTDPTSARDPDD
jgi:hypothetical protein